MSFDRLTIEVLEEFASFTSTVDYGERLRSGYSIRGPESAQDRQSRRESVAKRSTVEARAKAVETTRAWRKKQLADSGTASDYRRRRAAQSKRWRDANREKYRAMRRRGEAKQEAKLRLDAERYAAELKRRAERRRELRRSRA